LSIDPSQGNDAINTGETIELDLHALSINKIRFLQKFVESKEMQSKYKLIMLENKEERSGFEEYDPQLFEK